jgi:hypothetical protein
MTNLFACLVHERPETVADLVRNLRHLDPDSEILLYNGGRDRGLLREPLEGEPLVHPRPRPQTWGRLHGFALDCMRSALDEPGFDTLTIVDSDQLLLRRGYSEKIAAFLARNEDVGVLASATGRQPRTSSNPPVVSAWSERERWRALCRRLGDEDLYPHWTFWPGTVFTAAACRDLVRAFDTDRELARLVDTTRIFATEEILLPTLAALLGHRVAKSPCRDDYVKYRVTYSPAQLRAALRDPNVFWAHPIARAHDDPLRAMVRAHHHGYARTDAILERMHPIEGWLGDNEAEALITGLERAPTGAVVEVGSFCGRATTVLASVLAEHRPDDTVHAIDPHDGVAGARDSGLVHAGPTFARFQRNIARAGIAANVTPIRAAARDVAWSAPIAFLLIDGLHDYPSVSGDFRHFEHALTDGAVVAFHDYAGYFPGVRRFVDELVAGGGYERVALADSMLLLRRTAAARPARTPHRTPLVSCVMPTYNRADVVARAVTGFLHQDHEHAELIVVDDSPTPVRDLVPDDPRVRYLRPNTRLTIGAKRNLGFAEARGELLANWDDDDWYAPWRLSSEVAAMRATGADVVGLDRLLYLDPATAAGWRYTGPRTARAWAHDAVLLFTRAFWQRNPFPDTSVNIDTRLLWTPGRKQIVTLDDDFYVGMIHADNTSPKHTASAAWTPYALGEIAALMGTDAPLYGCAPALERAG